jgi:hypothetical protein
MKKITIAILMLLGSFSMASAELGVKLGASLNIGVFHATGTDLDASSPTTGAAGGAATTQSEDATGVAGFTSFFIEKDLSFLPGPFARFSIGYDYVNEDMAGESTETRSSLDSANTNTDKTNTVKIAFENMSTTYVTFNVTENLYVKAGSISVDLVTKESLGTGGSYGDESLGGDMAGIGMQQEFDNGLFVRAEGTLIDIDNPTAQTSGDHTITIKNIEGASARLSIGKSF